MFNFFRIIRGILKGKNSQIKNEREKYDAERAANLILSAYLALLVSKRGEVRIPKKEISDALGRFFVTASALGDDYIIEVNELPPGSRGKGADLGQTRKI